MVRFGVFAPRSGFVPRLECSPSSKNTVNHALKPADRQSGSGVNEVDFLGSVPSSMRHAVECLFFFNPQQRQLEPRIRATVEETGSPGIIEVDSRVWIGVPSGAMQCLFACARGVEPVGIALYGRPAPDLLWICHLVVDPGWCGTDGSGDSGLAGRMVDKIREIARSIKGVSRIQLPYRRSSFLNVR